VKPTPARLKAMREAATMWWAPRGASEWALSRRLKTAGLIDGDGFRYKATDAGRAWLAEHTKDKA